MSGLRGDPYNEEVERTAQTGRDDESDLFIRDGNFYVLVEAKNHKSIELADFVDQAILQRDNFAKARGLDPFDVMPLAVIKRRNKPWHQGYVATTIHEYFRRS